ncbi:MAG: hypothetical protein K6T34_04785 [Thermoflavifilum sp.]|nr:hypothetical protein [Thermoflavifilum sp.]
MKRLLLYGCWMGLLTIYLLGCHSAKKLSSSAHYPHFTHLRHFSDQASQQVYLDSLFIAAETHKQQGNFNRALFDLFLFLAYSPENAAAHFEISRLFAQIQQPDRALFYARKATILEPDNRWYQINYADLLVMNHRYDSAAAIFADLYRKHPYQTDYLYNEGVLLAESRFHREDSALKIFDQLEKINGLQEEYVYQKQRIYLAIDSVEAAAAEVRRLIHQYPDEPRYYRLLAQIYHEHQMDDSALVVWQALLSRFPNYPQGLIAVALQYRRKGDTAAYYRYMSKAFANPDLDIEQKIEFLYPFLKYIEIDSSQLEGAVRLAQMVIRAHPTDSRAFALYGDIWMSAGHWDSANRAYLQAITLDSSNITWWQFLMNAYAVEEQNQQLLTLSRQVMKLFPAQPEGYYYYGTALVRSHSLQQAVEPLQQALNLAQQDRDLKLQVLSLLGSVYNDLQLYSRSDSCFEAALALDPNNDLILNNYSYYLAERGEHLKKALQMIQKAVSLKPDEYSYEDTYAWVLFKLKDYTQALKWMQKSLAHPEAQHSSGYWVHYGDILFALHRIADAISSWKMAVEKGDTSEILQQKIQLQTLYLHEK